MSSGRSGARRQRVVVTGLGSVTPLGCDVASTWAAALEGSSGVRALPHLDERLPVRIAATAPAVVEVTAWRPEKRIITFKTDAYNQEEKQIVTGQSVLMVE